MPNLTTILRDEIRRLARKEIRAELDSTKKAVSQHRSDLAALKRENAELQRKVAFLEKREKGRLKEKPTPDAVPEGTRFGVRSLKAQRRRTGLSQAKYARLVGVSTMTMFNWESGNSRPADEHLAKLVELRGIGKREAERRLGLLDGSAG